MLYHYSMQKNFIIPNTNFFFFSYYLTIYELFFCRNDQKILDLTPQRRYQTGEYIGKLKLSNRLGRGKLIFADGLAVE